MQRCKYLDDLGLKENKYGTNFMPDDDERADEWREEREKYGFDSRETWCLNTIFIEWIYTRVKMYEEYASEVIDLSYHKIPYKGQKITQKEAIDKILSLAEEIFLTRDRYDSTADKVFVENSREICDLWKEVLPCMWW